MQTILLQFHNCPNPDTDSMTGMSMSMFRNIWIGIGIVAVMLTARGIYVMRNKGRK